MPKLVAITLGVTFSILVAIGLFVHGFVALKTGKYFGVSGRGPGFRTYLLTGTNARKMAWSNIAIGVLLLVFSAALLVAFWFGR